VCVDGASAVGSAARDAGEDSEKQGGTGEEGEGETSHAREEEQTARDYIQYV
jgi:hypothetical protein